MAAVALLSARLALETTASLGIEESHFALVTLAVTVQTASTPLTVRWSCLLLTANWLRVVLHHPRSASHQHIDYLMFLTPQSDLSQPTIL